MKFSERYGYTSIYEIQFESMNYDLKIGLWNQIIKFLLNYSRSSIMNEGPNEIFHFITNQIWGEHLKLSLDECSTIHYHQDLKAKYSKLIWYEVYDLIEYIAKNHTNTVLKSKFITACNEILKKENSAYRFIKDAISKITSEEEIAEIEKAMEEDDPFKTVSIHITDALKFLTDRKSPNYRNSIKESISAVESICNIITGKKKTSLGQAIKEVEKKVPIHKALKSAFQNLYGYTSDADGIRHALIEESNLDYEDARFILIACSAFVNYLKEKISKD